MIFTMTYPILTANLLTFWLLNNGIIVDMLKNFMYRRPASTLLERIQNLKPEDIDKTTRRPLKPVDDAYFISKTETLPIKEALRSIMYDHSLYKCLRYVSIRNQLLSFIRI